MKIYIAGKITDNDNYREQFQVADLYLKLKGHIVLNPADTIARIGGLKHEEYMIICKAMIDVADAVAFLPNWIVSKGANIEYDYACVNKKKIIFLRKEDLYVND